MGLRWRTAWRHAHCRPHAGLAGPRPFPKLEPVPGLRPSPHTEERDRTGVNLLDRREIKAQRWLAFPRKPGARTWSTHSPLENTYCLKLCTGSFPFTCAEGVSGAKPLIKSETCNPCQFRLLQLISTNIY